MHLSHSVKTNLSVAAVLTWLGLLSVATRQPSRLPSLPHRRHPPMDSGSLAALQDELNGVVPRPRAPVSDDVAHGREADTPSEIPARGWWDIARLSKRAGTLSEASTPIMALTECPTKTASLRSSSRAI